MEEKPKRKAGELKFSYGGQAVIEGVMMRGAKSVAIAMRAPDGEIVRRTATPIATTGGVVEGLRCVARLAGTEHDVRPSTTADVHLAARLRAAAVFLQQLDQDRGGAAGHVLHASGPVVPAIRDHQHACQKFAIDNHIAINGL